MQQIRKAPSIQSAQKGFSLLEILAVIVIIALLSVGVYAMFGGGLSGSKAIVHNQQVTGLFAAAKGIFPSPSYNGITAKLIIDSGKAPTNMVTGSGAAATLSNPWGGSVTIAAANYSGGTDNAFTITSPRVPKAECSSVVQGVAATFVEIKVGSTTVKDDTTPLDAAAVISACNNNSNDLVLTGV